MPRERNIGGENCLQEDAEADGGYGANGKTAQTAMLVVDCCETDDHL